MILKYFIRYLVLVACRYYHRSDLWYYDKEIEWTTATVRPQNWFDPLCVSNCQALKSVRPPKVAFLFQLSSPSDRLVWWDGIGRISFTNFIDIVLTLLQYCRKRLKTADIQENNTATKFYVFGVNSMKLLVIFLKLIYCSKN